MSSSAVSGGETLLLGDVCAQFPGDESPSDLDRLWQSYAYAPTLALTAFNDHHSAYLRNVYTPVIVPGTPEDIKLSAQLHVAAAFGGAILAAEAEVPGGKEVYRRMRSTVDKLGHLVMNQVAQPTGVVEDGGSALGVYLSASAADTQGFTVWEKPLYSRTTDFVDKVRGKAGAAAGYDHDSAHVDKM